MALDVARRVAWAISRVGARAALVGSEDKPFEASVQPVRDRNLQSLREGPWGIDRRRRAAMFAQWCESSAKLQVGGQIIWQGRVYRTLQVEVLEMAGQPLYVWAMLEPAGEKEEETPWT